MNKVINYTLILILMLSVIFNINAQVDPGTDDLTHSWTFNDGTAEDKVGGIEGILMGSAQISDGSLLTFEADSWMEMPADLISLNLYDEITLEVWFVPLASSNTGYHMIAYFGNSVNGLGSDGYFITPARGDDKSRAAISSGNESTPWSAESGADGPELDDGELHHMVSTLDPTDITLYIDGQLQMSTPLASNNSIANISTAFAYLARGGYTADPTWKGEILEFNIYNRALTPDEVLFLFNKGAITNVEDEISLISNEYSLSQNYPNPFNPNTTINYSIGKEEHVNLSVYDVLGNRVAQLVNENKTAGNYSVEFNAEKLSSGIYFYVLDSGNFKSAKKLILIK